MFELVEFRGAGHIRIVSTHETLEQAINARAEEGAGNYKILDCERCVYVHTEAADSYCFVRASQ